MLELLTTLAFCGFFLSIGMLLLWSGKGPGMSFKKTFQEKPWRRNAALGMCAYMAVISTLMLWNSYFASFFDDAAVRDGRSAGMALALFGISVTIGKKILETPPGSST